MFFYSEAKMKRRSFLKICILIIMFLGLVISSYAENVQLDYKNNIIKITY